MADAPALTPLEDSEDLAKPSPSSLRERRSSFNLPLGDLGSGRGDLRRELTQAVEKDDYQRAQRLFEPIVKEIAGEEWRVEMSEEGQMWCSTEEKVICIGWRKERRKEILPEVLAFDVYIGLIHELGHALYTPGRPSYYDGRKFARAAYYSQAPTNPLQLGMDFNWLDNVFSDARHRAVMRREHPEQASTVDWDRTMNLESTMILLCAYAGVDPSSELLSAETLGRLPASEQIGIMMLAELNDHPLDAWLESAAGEAARCFAYLRPYLVEVRDGKGVEHEDHLAQCYRVLTKHDLVPQASPIHYRHFHGRDGYYEALADWMAESLETEGISATSGPVRDFTGAVVERYGPLMRAHRNDLAARISAEINGERPALPDVEVEGVRAKPQQSAEPELAY